MTSPYGGTGLERAAVPKDIAIIGMACMFPGAPDLDTYWSNIISKVDCITDPPPEAWDPATYSGAGVADADYVYCKRGGYLGPLAYFDPLEHGIPPVSVGGEPDQWLALKLAREALADAGYPDGPKDGHRTAVIIGKGTYLNHGNLNMVQHTLVVDQTVQILKKLHPEYTEAELKIIRDELKQCLPAMGPETASGYIPNIIAGRIANRLDLMGPSYTVDAACASSLVAIDIAMGDLLSGKLDLAIVGGSQVSTPIPIFSLFCQLGALSRQQQIRPFDKGADGTVLGEGIGLVVLKRSSDAERDGDRIYATVKGLGTSSDGRGVHVMAPRVEGEELALRRAYEAAGISPRTVGLIEAHGTGTAAGDLAEVQALRRVFGSEEDGRSWCGLGTVKSMIGHTLPASGIAGVIKVALALYHKVLPPTLNCDDPNPGLKLENSPFYMNTETRPWIHGGDAPRRAGVNSFGFGGINAHAVLEEYLGPGEGVSRSGPVRWDTEVFIIQGETRAVMIQQVQQLQQYLATSPEVALVDLAYTLSQKLEDGASNLAVVASSLPDLQSKLAKAEERLSDSGCEQIKDRAGIYFFEHSLRAQGKLAFLFPGEGSQYKNMLSDLCLSFPEVRACFDQIDRVLNNHPRGFLPSDIIFPHPNASNVEEERAGRRLWQMDGAIEAVLTANQAMYTLLGRLGLCPEAILGHSTGEYSAMRASGIIDLSEESLFERFVLDLNGMYEQVTARDGISRASLVAVAADSARVAEIAGQVNGDIYIAMNNCPHQTVIVGDEGVVGQFTEHLRELGLIYQALPFDRAYHTPLFECYLQDLHQFFARLPVSPPSIQTWSCTTMSPFPAEVPEIRKLVVEHWARPVEFQRTIEAMYADGVRIFVEVGAKGNLTGFVDDILRGKSYLAVPANLESRSGITQINHLVGILTAQGFTLELDYLYRRRAPRILEFDDPSDSSPSRKGPHTSIKLHTGWPSIGLSEATLQTLRSRTHGELSPETPPAGALETTAAGVGVNSSPAIEQPTPQTQHDSRESGSQTHNGPGGHVPLVAPVTGERASDDVSSGQAQAGSTPEPMMAYLETMDRFLGTQQQIMEAWLRGPQPPQAEPGPPQQLEAAPPDIAAPRQEGYGFSSTAEADVENFQPNPDRYSETLKPAQGPANAVGDDANGEAAFEPEASWKGTDAIQHPFPLIGEITSLVPGQELVALRQFRWDEDLFLHDHTFGRRNSVTDPSLRPLPVMPLAMSMEMMAEAATLLMGDKLLVGMTDVFAHRWIALEEESITLKVVARILSGSVNEVEVQLLEHQEGEGLETASNSPLAQATLRFGESYPLAPAPEDLSLRGEGPSSWSEDALYDSGMFHGPCWQGVVSVDRHADDGCVATLAVLPYDKFFASNAAPSFVIDPIVLDAAGQVIGFWAQEGLESGYVVFPFRLEALHIYGPNRPVDCRVKCQAKILLEGEKQTNSKIDIIGPEGGLWMRLEGWKDRRFHLPESMFKFMLSPMEGLISDPWPQPISQFPTGDAFQCTRIQDPFQSDQAFWMQVWAHLVLTRGEREAFRKMRGPNKRRTEWLLGRIVAKDALRVLIKQVANLELCPADIEIGNDKYGRPIPTGTWSGMIENVPVLSLAHSDGIAVAVAGIGGTSLGVGVDIERIRSHSPSFVEEAYVAEERLFLQSLPEPQREEWTTRLWCVKEAVAKCLGRGLVEGPQSVAAQAWDIASGTVWANLRGKLANEFPEFGETGIAVYTAREGDYIVATTLWEGVLAE